MKQVLAILLMMLVAYAASAQDFIRLRNGETIQGKVVEVGLNDVKYFKNYHNGNGPVYIAAKSEVSEILYQSGVTEKFAMQNQPPVSSVPPPSVVIVEQPYSSYRRRPVVTIHLGRGRHYGIFRRHH